MAHEEQTENTVVAPSENQTGFPEVGLKGETFKEQIENIAREQGKTVLEDGTVVSASEGQTPMPEPDKEPETDASATTVEEKPESTDNSNIPEKFQKPDGTLDEAKVEKSTLNAEQAIERYRQRQKELTQASQETKKLEQSVDLKPAAPSLDGLAQQIEDEVKLNGTGVALAKLFHAAEESALKRAREELGGQISEVSKDVRSEREEKELKRIGKEDSWAFQEEGINAILSERQRNPNLSYTDAFYIAKGKRNTPNGQVNMPTPKKEAAPTTPASGARKVSPQQQQVDESDPVALNKYLDSLSKKDQEKFWAGKGMPKWIL